MQIDRRLADDLGNRRVNVAGGIGETVKSPARLPFTSEKVTLRFLTSG